MNYLQAENLKHKRTFARKLILLVPVITALLSAFAPLWYQINSYNWWYSMLYPGFLTLLCALMESRDSSKLKYQAVLPLPVSLSKVWNAKTGIAGIYAAIGNLLFLVLNLFGGIAIQEIFDIPLSIGCGQAVGGTFCIILVSLWEVPLCLWLSKKVGIFLTLVLNLGLGLSMGILLAASTWWMICPYSWVSHLMIYILGIMPNGTPAAIQNPPTIYLMICLTILLSLVLFVLLSIFTARSFEKQGVK